MGHHKLLQLPEAARVHWAPGVVIGPQISSFLHLSGPQSRGAPGEGLIPGIDVCCVGLMLTCDTSVGFVLYSCLRSRICAAPGASACLVQREPFAPLGSIILYEVLRWLGLGGVWERCCLLGFLLVPTVLLNPASSDSRRHWAHRSLLDLAWSVILEGVGDDIGKLCFVAATVVLYLCYFNFLFQQSGNKITNSNAN